MQLKKLDLSEGVSAAEDVKSVPTSDSSSDDAAKPASDTPKSEPTELKIPKTRRSLKKPLIILSVILLLLLIATAALAIPAYLMMTPAKLTLSSAQNAAAALQSQDLAATQSELVAAKDHLVKTQQQYRYLSWTKYVPIIRNYYLDGERGLQGAYHAIEAGQSLAVAIEPYADLLGFKVSTESAQPDATSAEERIVFLAQTLEAISPQLEQVAKDLDLARDQINQIDPNRYPVTVANKPIRANVKKLQETLSAAHLALTEAKPLIALLPDLLGQNGEKVYMLLFQNDAELRPTGGFMTAYAYVKVDRGKLTPLDSYDIYDLDARWNKTLPAPDPIKKYLPLVNNWNLRDMNLSPDFKASMETFLEHYQEIPGVRQIDGIIALDTQVPVELLKVLGPIGVGGWGEFSAENDPRCDCPQVVYALENIATRPTNYIREDRKAVLGPLMHSIVANAMGSPKSTWPQLLNVGLNALKEKHLLLYFPQESSQTSAEGFNAAGRILPFEGDYLHINDTNFAGAKSNMFITQTVEQDITLDANGSVTKTVTITYDNPHPPSNCDLETAGLCLNGVYRDWVRLYVPKGSTLTEVVGSEVAAVTNEDLGKTVFEAFFTLRPQSSSKLVFTYQLPDTYSTPFPMLIQKQPGKPNITHSIIFNGQPVEYTVQGDLEITLP